MEDKTIVICGGLGELGINFWTTYPNNHYILLDILPEPAHLKNKLQKYIYIKTDITQGNELTKEVTVNFEGLAIRVDAMLLTPAINPNKPFKDLSLQDIERVYSTKLYGYTNVIRTFVKYFNNNCSVVSVGSVHGQRTRAGFHVYAAANAGIEALMRGLAVEFAHQYRFNSISPGRLLTEYNKEHRTGWEDALKKDQLLELETVNNVVGFLFDGKSKGINGENIIIDAGISAMMAKTEDW